MEPTTAPIDLPRRDVLSALGLGAVATGLGAGLTACLAARPARAQETSPLPHSERLSLRDLGWDAGKSQFMLPDLPYEYAALEPHIDEATMRLHHDKHHAGYVRGLNEAMAALAEIRAGKSQQSVKHWSQQLAFNGSGHFLHVLFWTCMRPDGGGRPEGELAKGIDRDFGSFKAFSDHFVSAAVNVEASGWSLLVFEPISRQLMVMQAEKHQNLTAWGVIPIVALDVWEHAYYLKYQNRRKDYVDAFMNVVDWQYADHRYTMLMEALK